ncbi:hypothetical protein HNY73_014321 [Argiope bruennichi]|uniref:Uncharacterized protein n=1 Tax=Argiope bruennichi TaxID=94029 RepID=A0A8T0EQ99_ARGBR|nr:hypothetical protein HNY73_014321 [Argiope bruennichi]
MYLIPPLQFMICHLACPDASGKPKLMYHSDAQTESGDLQRDSTCDSIFFRGGTLMYLATARLEKGTVMYLATARLEKGTVMYLATARL